MNSSPNKSFIASSSGKIWNFVINKAKSKVKIIPPIKLNLRVIENNIKTIPKYIGFLEYLKTPEITSDDAFSISSGLTVVFCFLKDCVLNQ